MSKKFIQQKQQLLGSKVLARHSNTSVSTSNSWNVTLDANTSLIRVYSDNDCYLTINASANTSNWDYIIPSLNLIDLYNYENATSVGIIAKTANSSVIIGEY